MEQNIGRQRGIHNSSAQVSTHKRARIQAQTFKNPKAQTLKNPSTNAQESKHKCSRIQAQTHKNPSTNMQESKYKHLRTQESACTKNNQESQCSRILA